MQEKKSINKTIIIINSLALVVILGIAGFFVYDKYFNKKQISPNGLGMDFANMDIEDICKNFQNQLSDVNRQPPSNMNFNGGQRPSGNAPADFDSTKTEEQIKLIDEICSDGIVTDEERIQFEESKS